MVKIKTEQYNFAIQITSKSMGMKWKPVILWLLSQDTRRFSELQHLISGITQRVLTQQLRELENDGFIIRTVYEEVPPKVEYSLSYYGHTLKPILALMCDWGRKHAKEFEGIDLLSCGGGTVNCQGE